MSEALTAHSLERAGALVRRRIWSQDARVCQMADVRVLIVDDQVPFRKAARMAVEMTGGFEVAGVQSQQ